MERLIKINLSQERNISIEEATEIVERYASSIFYKDEDIEAFPKLLLRLNLIIRLADELPRLVTTSKWENEKDVRQCLSLISKSLLWHFTKTQDLLSKELIDSNEAYLITMYSNGLLKEFIRDNFETLDSIMGRICIELKAFCNLADLGLWENVKRAMNIETLTNYENSLRPSALQVASLNTQEPQNNISRKQSRFVNWVSDAAKSARLAKAIQADLGWIKSQKQFIQFINRSNQRYETVVCIHDYRFHIGFLLVALYEANHLDHKGMWILVEQHFRDEEDNQISKDWSNMLFRVRNNADKLNDIFGAIEKVLTDIGIPHERVKRILDGQRRDSRGIVAGREKESGSHESNFTT